MNKVERIKQEKNGLDVWDDIQRYAEAGFAAIPEDDFTRLRWWGIYQQRPNDGHFMVRVKIPGGRLTADQADAIASVAEDFGRGLMDITTRQDIQYHWLTIENMPEALRRLNAAGLTTQEACGDVPRNVTGCPLHGVSADEIVDGAPLVDRINRRLLDDRGFSDLPRKFKVCVSGCGAHCARPEINDVAFVAVRDPETGETGYNVLIGGGLSTQPHFAQSINAWVSEDEAVDVAAAVTEIFRDDGYRVSRHRARLKYLMEDWGPETFRERVQARLSFPLRTAAPFEYVDLYEDHLGVRPQKQAGLYSLGVAVLVGRLNVGQMRAAAEVARTYGEGRLSLTLTQNLIVLDVAGEDVARASQALDAAGLPVGASDVRRAAITCTGIEFCNLAVAETKNRMVDVVNHLEARGIAPGAFRMHMNGCPNSCGQHHIADIGFMGGRVKLNGETRECFDISVGGGVGEGRAFVHNVRRKVLAEDVPAVVANLLDAYAEHRGRGENLRTFLRRHSDEEINGFLGSLEVPADAVPVE
ncbi:MAG TPA: nitrite/sulfite reductase [Armatimonadota bacterium]|jgi:precorrin-3B synthase